MKSEFEEIARNIAAELASDSAHIPVISLIVLKHLEPLRDAAKDKERLDWNESELSRIRSRD